MQRRQFIAGLVATGLASAVPSLQLTSANAVAALDAAVARAVRLEQRSQYAALSALLPGSNQRSRKSRRRRRVDW